jgi:hypothetical protein
MNCDGVVTGVLTFVIRTSVCGWSAGQLGSAASAGGERQGGLENSRVHMTRVSHHRIRLAPPPSRPSQHLRPQPRSTKPLGNLVSMAAALSLLGVPFGCANLNIAPAPASLSNFRREKIREKLEGTSGNTRKAPKHSLVPLEFSSREWLQRKKVGNLC